MELLENTKLGRVYVKKTNNGHNMQAMLTYTPNLCQSGLDNDKTSDYA